MITAQVEQLANGGLDELMPILPKHWEELALNKDKVPLNPQYDKYLLREQMGEVMYITARHNGELVGYFVGFVAPGMHYKTCLTLTMDILYALPTKRGMLQIGNKLLDCVEAEARRRGVQRGFMGQKVSHPALGRLLVRRGWEQVEVYFSKWFGD